MTLVAVSTLFLAASSVASAQEGKSGLMIEPSISYEIGDTSIGYPAPFSNSTGTASGFGLGARLGFHFEEAFFLGLDARYSFPQYKDSSVNYDSAASSVNVGPVIGMQMPNMGLRVWGALVLGGDLDPAGSNFDVTFSKRERVSSRCGLSRLFAQPELGISEPQV